MSGKAIKSKTLANKLKEKTCPGRVVEVQDIEDSLQAQVPFFSPIQTRQQRKVGKRSQEELKIPLKVPSLPSEQDTNFKKLTAKTVLGKNATTVLDIKPIQTKEFRQKINDVEKLSDEVRQEDIKPLVHGGNWEPKNWHLVLNNIKAMRYATDAPVDTMGCHKCSDDEADEKTQRFQKLVALMLSSQTKDEITFEVMQRLKSKKLIPETIVRMERAKLEELLKPVSFYKNKAKYLQLTSLILIDKYDHDIPGTIKELEALPGVGPKMAHICMATAWNEVTGIGVDVHVHRITNRLRWIPKPTKEPEQTRVALEAWLPREMWRDVNHLFVGFGQTICKAVRPNCMDCLNRNICPASECKTIIKSKNFATIQEKESANADMTISKKTKLQSKKDV